jgi:hypothetical protein
MLSKTMNKKQKQSQNLQNKWIYKVLNYNNNFQTMQI